LEGPVEQEDIMVEAGQHEEQVEEDPLISVDSLPIFIMRTAVMYLEQDGYSLELYSQVVSRIPIMAEMRVHVLQLAIILDAS
jgi:hypothetical protein